MNETTDWKLYSLLEESAATVELYLGKPEYTSSFDASTGATHHYTKEYFYYEKGILLEFLTLFGKTFRPSPTQTTPKLKKITLFSKWYEYPNGKPYTKEILNGIYLGKEIKKEEIEKYSLELENKGIKAKFILNDNFELERVILESIPEKFNQLSELKIEQKTAIIPKYKIENEWNSQGHTWEVTGLTYFAEKDILVSVSQDATCKYWSFDSSNSLNTYQYGEKWKPGFTSLSKTNSEKEILIGNKAGEILLWNLETLKVKKISLSKKQEGVEKIILVEDNLILASVISDYLYAYSISEEKILYRIKGDLAFGHFPFAIHKTKKEIVNGNTGDIHSLEDGKKLGTIFDIIGYQYGIREVEFSENQKLLFVAFDNSFALIDYETKLIYQEGKLKTSGGLDNKWRAKFILEDKFLVIASFGVLKVIEVQTKNILYHIIDFEYGARSIEFVVSRNLILLGSWDGRILGFDLHSGEKNKIWGGHKGLIYSIAANNDKSLFISGDSEGYLYFWDGISKNLLHFYKIHNSTITTIEVLPDGNILTGSWEKTVKVSDVSGKILWEIDAKDWVYNAFWIKSKQSVLFSNREGLIQLVDWKKNLIYEIQIQFTETYHSDFDLLAYSEVNEEFAFINKNYIHIHDIHTGKEKIRLDTKETKTRISFSPDGGKLFLSDYVGNIHCMHRTTGEILTVLRGHIDRVSHFHFFEDWMVSTGREEKVFVWNWKTLELIASQNHSAGGISPVVILNKTQILCGATNSSLVLKKITINE